MTPDEITKALDELDQRLSSSRPSALMTDCDVLRELLRINAALAATQCHDGYADEYGNHLCCYQDHIAELEKARDESAAERERVRVLEGALEALVNRLDFIHEDGQFKSVWVLSYIHGAPYTGPTYVNELARARAALAGAAAEGDANAAREAHRQSFDLVALEAARKIDGLFGASFRNEGDVKRRASVQCLILDLLAEHTTAEGDGWLPGSSAPRDGTEFIGAEYCGSEDEGAPMWLRDLHDAHWNAVKSGFTNGWGDLVTITHWRPSFPPPSAGAIGRERVQVAEGDGWLPIDDLGLPDDRLVLGYRADDGAMMIWRVSILLRNIAGPTPQHLSFLATHYRELPLPPPSAGAKEGETT